MAPATARPRHATPTRHCTASSRPSTNSRVPSTGSTNTVSASRGSVQSANPACEAASGPRTTSSHRSRRSGAPGAGFGSSSSSPTMRRPGHRVRSAFTIASCAAVSASVRAERGSSASLRVLASSPPEVRLRSCTARISAQPFRAASTHEERSSTRDTGAADDTSSATGITRGDISFAARVEARRDEARTRPRGRACDATRFARRPEESALMSERERRARAGVHPEGGEAFWIDRS